MKKTSLRLILCLLLTCIIALAGCSGEEKKPKPTPEEALGMLKAGNERFLRGESEHPNLDKSRMMKASLEDQGDHAYAAILASSDSRVPVEAIFDAGIMDLFVVRVPGNVCGTDQVGAIEYGLEQVRTPVVVVMGNTQCAAVTAVTRAVNGQGHADENKPLMFDNIEPAVKKAMEKYPKAKGDQIITLAVEENVYTSIRDLFMKSPATRDLVKNGKVKVVGAIYDVSDGRVYWLEDDTVAGILQEVESPADDATAPPAVHEEATEADEAAVEIHETAPEVHESAVETHEAAADEVEVPTKADETHVAPETHDTAVSHDAAAESSEDHEKAAPEDNEAAPAEADEAHAEPETKDGHDTHSHQ